MNLSWQPMSLADFAAFEGLLGQQTAHVEGTYWSRVRPFYYRPLLVFDEYSPGSVRPPWPAVLGGFQHAVPPGCESNSVLNLLLFGDLKAYSPEALDYNRRRQIRLAIREFEIRPLQEAAEFKQKAYPIYLSFYERTRYSYGSWRRKQASFCAWADALFRLPNVLALGGYRKGELGGVSLSFLIGDTLIYATFFCDTPSMRLCLSDLMLHFIREQAGRHQAVRQIFCGMHKGGNGLDDFYLLRGCGLVRKPARVQINPLARHLLQSVFPQKYKKLTGEIDVH